MGFISNPGVSKLVAGSNISLNPSGGTGAVTVTGTGGGGGGFPPADYNVTNPGSFTFPAPFIVNAVSAVGPSTFTDTGGSGGFFFSTDSNSGGISLQATGFSGINLSSQADSSFDSSGNLSFSGTTIANNGPTTMNAGSAQTPLVVKAVNGQSVDLVQNQGHTGTPISRVNNVGDFVLSQTSGAPSDTPTVGSCRFDPAANTLYIYGGAGWKSTILV